MCEYMALKNIIDDFYGEKCKALEKIYDPSIYRTAVQLKDLMEREFDILFPLQNAITSELRAKCIEGIGAELGDAAQYPNLVWADYVREKYTTFSFPLIKDSVPVAKIKNTSAPSRSIGNRPELSRASSGAPVETYTAGVTGSGANAKGNDSGMPVEFIVGGGGIASVAVGVAMTPISGLLLALGIVLIAGSGLMILKKKSELQMRHMAAVPIHADSEGKDPARSKSVIPQNEANTAGSAEERDLVWKILSDQTEATQNRLRYYCDDAYRLACEALDHYNSGRDDDN